MKAYPLKSISIQQATQFQFDLVDAITREFNGYDILTQGDLGLFPKDNKPKTTAKVEKVIANFFNAEAAIFVRGAGTAAIREALASILKSGDTILLHNSPIYPTTITSLKQLGLNTIECDFNDKNQIAETLKENKDIKAVLIQYTRQTLSDSYDMAEVIEVIRKNSDAKIITDDNYAVMKVDKIGSQMDADLSCFSMFKLLGPEGIGCVVGKSKHINEIKKFHYSGGSQVQGHEAMSALKSLVYAPVALAIQAVEIEKLAKRLNNNEIEQVSQAVVVNAQSKVVLVKFNKPIAQKVLEQAAILGAAPYPIGAESRYEVSPMFYKLSGTMLRTLLEYKTHWIRINPMRSGSDTIIRILKEAIEKVD